MLSKYADAAYITWQLFFVLIVINCCSASACYNATGKNKNTDKDKNEDKNKDNG
jgi:hypothetical protein